MKDKLMWTGIVLLLPAAYTALGFLYGLAAFHYCVNTIIKDGES